MTSRPWLRYEREIIADLFDRIRRWDADGRKPPQTYFTAGLEREVAQMIQRAIDEAVEDKRKRVQALEGALRYIGYIGDGGDFRDVARSALGQANNEPPVPCIAEELKEATSRAQEAEAREAFARQCLEWIYGENQAFLHNAGYRAAIERALDPFPVAAALVELERAARSGSATEIDAAIAALDWARGGR